MRLQHVFGWSLALFFCASASAGQLTTVASFSQSLGSSPSGALVRGKDGNFYGVASGGGSGYGTVFKMTAAGKLTVLHAFGCNNDGDCLDGANPVAGLVEATDGNFYGTTSTGGRDSSTGLGGGGTVFRVTPDGQFTTLYVFCSIAGCLDGSNPSPYPLVQAADGTLVGTTDEIGLVPDPFEPGDIYIGGTGSIYKISLGGTLTTTHIFCPEGTGEPGASSDPDCGSLQFTGMMQGSDGNLYGAIQGNGIRVGYFQAGTVFKVDSRDSYSVIYSFCSLANCADGLDPFGLIAGADGTLYGSTISSSAAAEGGAIFQLTISGDYSRVFTACASSSTGQCSTGSPYLLGKLVMGTDGTLYGADVLWGTTKGGLFGLSTGGTFSQIYVFCAAPNSSGQCDDGSYLTGLTQSPDGKLYGMTPDGGVNHAGSVFAVDLSVSPPSLGITISPSSLTFPNQTVGTVSTAQMVTLKNSGSATLNLSSILLIGSQADDFGLTNTCGKSLAPSASCTLSVTFNPVSVGVKSARIQISDNVSGSPQVVSISGTAVAATATPAVKLSASSVTFGNVSVKTTSASKSVTLTNMGTGTLQISSIQLGGGQSDDFALSKTCGTTLAAGASCTLSITFTPVSAGTKSSTIKITDNASGSPQTVSLSGTGIAATSAPGLKLSVKSLAFGNEAVKTTSASKSISVSNTGTGLLTIGSITLGGGQADDFASTTTCGSSLAAGASCTITVTFTPVSTGAKSASISIADNASGSPQSVSLSGTGA